MRKYLFIVLAMGTFAEMATAAQLPRYAIKPGEKLIYVSQESEKGPNYSDASSGEIELTVLNTNPDGSWRVLDESTSQETQQYPGEKTWEKKSMLCWPKADVFDAITGFC